MSASNFSLSDGRKVRVLANEDGIAAAVCEEFVAAAKAAISAKGSFSVAVPGGSIVAALAKVPKGAVDASKIHVFFCNERLGEGKCYKGAMKSLAEPLGIPPAQVYQVPDGKPEDAASKYAALMKGMPREIVGKSISGMPVVDLVLLGTGEDGHVGSLHPNKAEIRASGSGKAVLPINEGGKTSVAVSLDFICAARKVVLSAAKASRAPMVLRALRTGSGCFDCPASMVCAPETTWLVDKDSIGMYASKKVFDPPVAQLNSYWDIPGMKAGVITGDLCWALLRFAKAKGFAIPAVNCTSTSTVNAVLEAGKALNRPVIIQFSEGGSAFFAGKSLPNNAKQASTLGAVAGATYTRAVAPAYGIPVIVHSDHCAKKLLPWFDGMLNIDEAHYAKYGEPLFSSHMLDLSEEPHEENIGICAKYLERMAKVDLILEMEIGITGGVEDGVDNSGVSNDKLYSTPHEVWQVYETLAPISEKFTIAAAFGNVHGVYKPGNVVLRPELLGVFQRYAGKILQGKMPLNFVFHGGSGSEKEKIDEARSYGVVKMNVDTDTQWAYWEGIRDFYEDNEGFLQGQIGNPNGMDKPNKNYYDPRKWVREGEATMTKRVKESCKDLHNFDGAPVNSGCHARLVFSRHGESEWNVANKFTGWVDVDLSEKGIGEAKGAGELLKKEGLLLDVCYTSYLKRAIKTCNLALESADQLSVNVNKTWRLNERMYGGLTGLDKKETVKKHGAEQVQIWRRSFDLPPRDIDEDSEYHPKREEKYAGLKADELPKTESLKTVIDRVMPYWEQEIKPQLAAGKTVFVAAHGNSIRAIVKYIEGIPEDVIPGLEIPTGTPLVYELDRDLKPMSTPLAVAPLKYGRYLGDVEKIKAAAEAVKNQTKVG